MVEFPRNIDLISLLGFGFGSVAIFLGLFFIVKSRLKNEGYLWLYIILLLLSAELWYKSLIHSRVILDFPFWFKPHHYYNLLLYPLFLGFVWQIRGQFAQKKYWFWGLLLIIGLFQMLSIFTWLNISMEEKQNMLMLFYEDRRPGPFNYWSNWVTLTKGVLVPMTFLIAIIYSFYLFYEKSAQKADRRLLYLMTAVISLYFIYTQLANWIYKIAYQWTDVSMIEWPVDICFLSFVILLLGVIAMMVNTGTSLFPTPKYAGSALEKSKAQSLAKQADEYLKKHQIYLNPDLNIKQLAQELNTNDKYLSQSINQEYGVSFIQWLNAFRVEEAKLKLQKEEHKHLTLEAIGNLSGFRSKSSFFNAFKKRTGQTPNQFQKSKSI